MYKKFVTVLCLLITTAMADAINITDITDIQSIKADNVEIHLGQGNSQTITFADMAIGWEETKIRMNNKIMGITWQNDRLHFQGEGQEIWLPFIEETVDNEFNQYYFTRMNIDFETQKHIEISVGEAEIVLKNSANILEKFYLRCERKFNTLVDSTLELCLTDRATVELSALFLDQARTNLLEKFVFMGLMESHSRNRRIRHQQKAESTVQELKGIIRKNVFLFEGEFEGKNIDLEGTIRYDSQGSRLKIVITDASYFIFSIKRRIYKELRSIKSRYLSVDSKGVITLKLDQF